MIWIQIKLKGKSTLYVSAFYRPDVSDADSLIEFETSLQRATQIQNANLLIGGDFNLPGWDWVSMSTKYRCPYPNLHYKFVDILSDHGLEQIVQEPTRGDNTLDLLITNSPQLVPRTEVIPGLSDHDIAYCEFTVKTTRKIQPIREIALYSKANWEQLKTKAKAISNTILKNRNSKTTEELWLILRNTLQDSVKLYVPHKKTKKKVSLPWITSNIKKLISKKKRLYRKMKKSGNADAKSSVKNLKKNIQRETRQSYWSYLNDIFQNENGDTKNKKFWSYIKHQKSSNIGIAPLKKEGQLISDPKQQAELLNLQFQSVFSEGKEYTDDEFKEKVNMKPQQVPVMEDIKITDKGVEKLVKSLNPHKASGPDGISPYILKELATELTPGLTTIFQSSLSSGEVPKDWKRAHVTPIFKKGEHYDPANYRPISLTCIVCKLMEHILVSAIMQHFERNNVLTDHQHGFRRLRSCETQLLDFTEELTVNLESGQQTDVLIMDFAKAFDRVNHSLLIHKISCYGIQGTALTWINNFLRDRKQAVIVNGTCSPELPVRSGVPQGSVLGPCLFLAYINDLPADLNSKARLFADDTAIYSSNKDHLQQDLNKLAAWEKSWDMLFHPAKCFALSISRKRNPTANSYHLHGHMLENVTSTKYLGVTLRNDLTWDEHINNISNKANKTIGFLRRNLKISSQSIKEKAYKAFVRPALEYASTVWDPHTQKNIDKLESIQRRAARFVMNRYNNISSVSTMLHSLNWQKLAKRRKVARLAMLYKIKHHLAKCMTIKNKIKPAPTRSRRTHDQQFCLIPHKTQYRGFSYLPRTIRDWNQLSTKTVEATTPDNFVAACYENT